MKATIILKINKIIILICIINIIFSIFILLRDRTVLNLNNNNRDTILNYLNSEINNSKFVTKVSYDRVWHDSIIYVHYLNFKVKELTINEGDFALDDLADYIKQYGYKESTVAIILSLFSIITIIILVILQIFLTKKRRSI